MSNVIPIVSSSPPPMDDGGFDWEDNDDFGDDDFGHFATAPSVNKESSCEDFSPQWPKEASSSPQPDPSSKANEASSSNGRISSDTHSNYNSSVNSNCHDERISNEPSTFPASLDGADISDQRPCGLSQSTERPKDISHDPDINFKAPDDQLPIHVDDPTPVSQSACSGEVGESVYSNASISDSGMFGSDMMSPVLDDVVAGNGENHKDGSESVDQQQFLEDHKEDEDGNDWADFNSAVTSEIDLPVEKLDVKCDEPVLEEVSKSEEGPQEDKTDIDNPNFKDHSTNSPLSSQHVESSVCDKKDISINATVVGQNDLENSVDGWQPFDATCKNENQQECDSVKNSPNNVNNLTEPDDLSQEESDKADVSVAVNGSDEVCTSERNLASEENGANEEAATQVSSFHSDDGNDGDLSCQENATVNSVNPNEESSDHKDSASEEAKPQTLSSHNDDDFGDLSCHGNEIDNELNPDNEKNIYSSTCDQSDDNNSQGNNDDDDEEFGSFSTSQDKKTDSKEEVAPISFRTTECEEDEDNENSPHLQQEADIDNDDNELKLVGKDQIEEDDAFPASTDDFGDFDSAMNKSCANPDEEEFGDFGAFDKAGEGGDDSGWADFDAAPPSDKEVSQHPTETAPVQKAVFKDQTNKVEAAVLGLFPLETNIDSEAEQRDADSALETLNTVVELGLHNNVEEAKQQTWTVVQHPAKRDPRVRLWNHLRDVDSSAALDYSWPSSHCSSQVFSTLHIDTKNILFSQKKQAVPFIPSGILEPIRNEGKKTDKREAATLLDTGHSTAPPTVSVQDIPPVDFDWSSSGLTNPLTANTLDLDFLVVQATETFEKATDEWDWVFKSDTEETPKKSHQPLEDIMKHSTPTAKLASQEVLTPEAMLILRKMPNLSFMQSRVLMFPIKQ